jgi:hypothetical protein
MDIHDFLLYCVNLDPKLDSEYSRSTDPYSRLRFPPCGVRYLGFVCFGCSRACLAQPIGGIAQLVFGSLKRSVYTTQLSNSGSREPEKLQHAQGTPNSHIQLFRTSNETRRVHAPTIKLYNIIHLRIHSKFSF